MQCGRIYGLRKVSRLLVHATNCPCKAYSRVQFLDKQIFCQPSRDFYRTPVFKDDAVTKKIESLGMMQRLLGKIGILDIQKYRSIVIGYMTYEDIADNIDYNVFYKDFGMPDTMFSWFLVMELHVWMAMLRYMAEEKYGKIVREHIVRAMWEDTEIRVQKLGDINSKVRKKQLRELSGQFNAAIVSYDLGILSDDKTLAGVLWLTFFDSKCDNPELLERLLVYVRKQVNILDEISSAEILSRPAIKWLELKNIR